MFNKEDIKYMKQALRLAARGAGICSPDPMVGAVVVKDGSVIATGYHLKQGTPHAEAVALKKAGERARGATLYVNLEPCCHWGNNPPCVLDVIAHGIGRVVVAMRDPNPLVRDCNSEKILQDAGIAIEYGCLEAQALKLNEFFIKYITLQLPFVILKAAMTLDGKIATRTGESKWISGGKSRAWVHKLRSEVDAVLVGIGTVLADDPLLTVRNIINKYQRQPIRIVLDSYARTPLNSKLIRSIDIAPLIIIVADIAPQENITKLAEAGVEIMQLKSIEGRVQIADLLPELAKRKIMSVLVEGGGSVNFSFIQERMADKVLFFIAPKFVGGKDALTPVEGAGISGMADAVLLKNMQLTQIDEDILVEGYL